MIAMKTLAALLMLFTTLVLAQAQNTGDLGSDSILGDPDLALDPADALVDDDVSLKKDSEVDLPPLDDVPEAVTPADQPEEEQPEELALPESVRRLKDEQKIEIQRLLREAAQFIQGIRLQEGLDRLIQVEAITPDLYQTHNLRGAIYTKLRDFDKARVSFQRALELSPNLMEAQFNLAELDFVEKKFDEAAKGFRKLRSNPKIRPETKKLIDYKLFISTLLQSESPGDTKHQEAMAMLESFDFMDDFPVYYYANAALSFHQDNKEEAEGWLQSARRIYDKDVQVIYIDALVEMGWVDSL